MYTKKDLEISIKKHEGFSSRPYPDYIHGWDKPTFGHGLTYIEYEESEWILRRRIEKLNRRLEESVCFYKGLPDEIQGVLIEMAYQMGLDGLLAFKETLRYLREGKWDEAADEMLDSKWYKEDTPKRAKSLSEKVRRYGRRTDNDGRSS